RRLGDRRPGRATHAARGAAPGARLLLPRPAPAGVCRAAQPPARAVGARGLSALRARREPFAARRAGGGTAAARAPVAADAARLGTARPPGGVVRKPPPPARRAARAARRARRLRAPAHGRAAGSLQPRGGRLPARRRSLAPARGGARRLDDGHRPAQTGVASGPAARREGGAG